MYTSQRNNTGLIRRIILLALVAALTSGVSLAASAQTGGQSVSSRGLMVNQPPLVTVGIDQTVTLAGHTFLHGVVQDDTLTNPSAILNSAWSKISGPGTVTFGNNSELLTWATFSSIGTYVLRLTVNDGALNSSDDLTLVVISGPAHTLRVPQDYGTIQAAINAAQAGDLVLVSPGTYVENLSYGKSIILASTFYTTGDPARIDQTIISSPSTANPTILIGSAAGPTNTIIGLTIKNGDDGVKIHGNASVFSSKFSGQAADAVDYAGGAAGMVMDNYFSGNDDDAVDIDDADVLIEHNEMVANGEGVEIRASNHLTTQLTIIIRDNRISANRKTGLQLIDIDSIANTAALLIIDRNLIFNNPQSGLSLMSNKITTDDYSAPSLLERIRVFNNSFVNNNYGMHGGDNLVAVNNIFAGQTGTAVKKVDGGSVLSYNLFWNNGTDNDGSNVVPGTTVFADPRLDADYMLQSGSAAIDKGTASFTLASGQTVLNIPPSAYDGSAPDIGKYESGFASGPTSTPTRTSTPTATSTSTKTPTPGPSPTATKTPSLSDVIFADGFESGSFSAWSASRIDSGDLSVKPAAAMQGSQGMQVLIDDTTAIYLTDETPTAEPRYRARFYFDPNSISMADGSGHYIFSGYMGTSVVLRVEFRLYSGNYQLRVRQLDDNGSWRSTLWFSISDAPHPIEFDWRAASAAGANNGGITLWIDGSQKASISTVDNDTRRIDRIRFGAVAAIDGTTLGTYYLDAFESRRQTYIGP